jgi:hypothetical protein|tara:strand:- start:912 stop:1031 length:120 start_codon:yes stop_codon:yes gene_type:complete
MFYPWAIPGPFLNTNNPMRVQTKKTHQLNINMKGNKNEE